MAVADCIFQGQEPTNTHRDATASPEHCTDKSARKGAAPETPLRLLCSAPGAATEGRIWQWKPACGPSICIVPVFVALQPEEDIRELERDLGGGRRMINAAEGAGVWFGEVIKEIQME